MDALKIVEKSYIKKDLPQFKPGDTLKVYVKIQEGGKERSQAFEGIVISRRGGGINETFTLRKISQGVGVERIFLLHSPNIDRIRVIKEGSVRRAKLYYLREKVGKTAKIKRKSGTTQG